MSFLVALHGPLSSLFQPLGVPSRTPCPTFGGSLSSLLQPLSGPSPFFVALRGYLFAFSWISFLPLAILGLSSLLQPLRRPFAVLRGPSWISFCLFLEILSRRSLAGPSQASSNPFVALRRSSWPFVDIFLPFPGNPFSPWRPMADPSRASSNPFVALRCSSWPFVDIFLPFRGNPFSLWRSLADPSLSPTPSWPFGFVALRGYPFSWKSFLPLAAHGGSLSSLLQPLRGPSLFFVALRGYLFAFSWK